MRRAQAPLGRIDRAGVLVGIAVCAMFCLVLARVSQLQLAPGETLAAYAENRVASRPVQGYRGELLDRRGRLLSTSRIGYRLFVDPEEIDRDRLDELVMKLAELSGEPADRVGESIIRAISINDARRSAAPQPGSDEPHLLRALLAAWREDHAPEAGVLDPAGGEETPAPALLRYVAIGGVLADDRIGAARNLDLPGVHLERRPVREYPAGEVVASLVGKVGFENTGLLGAELALEEKLLASDGTARYVRDAWGRPLWIERGQWTPASHGESQRLSVDLELQRIASEELRRGVEEADGAGGLLLMLDPLSGEILAMVDIYRDVGELPEFPWVDAKPPPGAPPAPAYNPADHPRYRTLLPDPGRDIHPALGRIRCVEDIYEPGSTFKPFVWSLVTESGVAKPDEVFDTEGGRWIIRHGRSGRYVEDVTKRPEMTWTEVLINSSNIGMIKGASRLTFEQLRSGLVRFGFGSRTGIRLRGEATGRMTPLSKWSHWTQESVAHGNEISVTPLQLARAYCAFARPAELAGTLPTITLLATGPNPGARDALIRVLPPDVAIRTRIALRSVAENAEQALARKDPSATGWRYLMFGKSGTAEIPLGAPPEGKKRPRGATGYFDDQYNSSFVAGAPLESPRLLVVVVINDPGPELVDKRAHYGSRVAAPVARRVLERSLTYLGVEPDAPAPSAPVLTAAGR